MNVFTTRKDSDNAKTLIHTYGPAVCCKCTQTLCLTQIFERDSPQEIRATYDTL